MTTNLNRLVIQTIFKYCVQTVSKSEHLKTSPQQIFKCTVHRQHVRQQQHQGLTPSNTLAFFYES